MHSPFLSASDASLNPPNLSKSNESDSDSSSDSVFDTIHLPLQQAIRRRRPGLVFMPNDFYKTRGDIVKEVNLKLLPFIQITLVYVAVLSSVYWIIVTLMPPFFVISCSMSNNYTLMSYFSSFLIITCLFEYKHALAIVKIIQPLSGHNRLGNMQYIKLGLGFMGKMTFYTKYCFVLLSHQCSSRYAWIATALIMFWGISLLGVTIYYYLTGGVNFLQLTDYGTLFELLGKYETMYLEGEKSSAHLLQWTKRQCILPVMKLFFHDIGMFIMQMLFLIEMGQLNYFVLLSLVSSLATSIFSVAILYIKYEMNIPNLDKEQIFLHEINSCISKGNLAAVEKLLGSPKSFRKYGHEVRAEVFKNAAKTDSDLFSSLTKKYIVKNDGLLQSDTFHGKLINSLRNCKDFPENLITSFNYLRKSKNIYLNINKRIRISTGGTILHCLVEDPSFILRSVKTFSFDLIEYVEKLGLNVNIEDKFNETGITLIAKLNLNTLIKSCSTKKLIELIEHNSLIEFNKEDLDISLKKWAREVVKFLVMKGADINHENKKKMNAYQIAQAAENTYLSKYMLKQLNILPESKGSVS